MIRSHSAGDKAFKGDPKGKHSTLLYLKDYNSWYEMKFKQQYVNKEDPIRSLDV